MSPLVEWLTTNVGAAATGEWVANRDTYAAYDQERSAILANPQHSTAD